MSNLFDEISRERLRRLADEVKDKIAAKKKDGEFCLICRNFVMWAEKNTDKGFICYSCKNPTNQVIYDYQEIKS